MNIPKISGTLRHTFIEGWLYWYTAFGTTLEGYLSTEESYKYINPQYRFWLSAFIVSTVAGFNAVKAFRSMTFGRAYGQPTVDIPPTKVEATVSTQPNAPQPTNKTNEKTT